MKKILIIILISLIIPMVSLADWCTNVGGHWEDNAYGMDTCICPDGSPASGGSCDDSSNTGGSTTGGSTTGGSTTGGDISGGDISGPTGSSSGQIQNPIEAATFADLINMIVDWIINIALFLAPLVVVWGGVMYITSAGDPGKSKKGRDMIVWAMIGFIIVLLSKSLVGILKDLVVK